MVKYPQHVNAIGGYYLTPALAALAGRHFELARLLHRNKSSLEPRNHFENTPLHFAAGFGDLEMVQVLLDVGLDVNAKNNRDSTPLDFVIYRDGPNDPRVARLLIAHGADPNAQDIEGITLLHRASKHRRTEMTEIVRLLIEHGANVEVKDNDGRTPLDLARSKQHGEIVKLLSEHLAK
jgi:ankyrin repeat protein